jgi:GNAT superfamily N-acetyltransferase
MKTTHIDLQYYSPRMYEAFKSLMQDCFADLGGDYATEEEMNLLSDLYPRGQIMAFDGKKLVGAVISRVVPFEKFSVAHTQEEVIDLDRYVSDAEEGNALYGLDIFVHADYRSLKLGKMLYDSLYEEFYDDNFEYFLGVSLLCGYAAHATEMSPWEYVKKVENGEIKDPALSFHLYNGMKVLDVMTDFHEGDIKSNGCGAVIGYQNPHYNEYMPTYEERAAYLSKFLVHA